MQRVRLEEAQKRLPELVRNLSTEGDLLIFDADLPVARLIGAQTVPPQDYSSLAVLLQGAGAKFRKSGVDPIHELVSEREKDDTERSASVGSPTCWIHPRCWHVI